MEPKTLKVQCIGVFVSFWRRIDKLESEYENNPTKENWKRLESLRQQMLHYCAITRGKSVLDFLN